jgi:hypothetical protein
MFTMGKGPLGLEKRKAAGEVVRTLLAEPTAQGLFPEHPIPGTKKPVSG